MFGSNVLEVAIGLVFVYWFLGLLCSSGPPPQSKAGATGSASVPPQQLVVAVSGTTPQTGTNGLGTAGSTSTTE